MMIFGLGTNNVVLGSPGSSHCAVCDRPRSFSVRFVYRYIHVLWLFGLLLKKRYVVWCDVCERGGEIPLDQAQPFLRKQSKPWMWNVGSLVLLVGRVPLVLLG